MCGIFGFFCADNHGRVDASLTKNVLDKLFLLSEARGKESSGIAVKSSNSKKIYVLKKSIPASNLIKSKEYKNFFDEVILPSLNSNDHQSTSIIAHARLVTNGSQENNNNNQPVIKDHIVAVHNGIITNVDKLWEKHKEHLKRNLEVDTEVFLALHQWYLSQNHGIVSAIRNVFSEIQGTASIAMLYDFLPISVVATNNGSLYYSYSSDNTVFIFASEKYILRRVIDEFDLKSKFKLQDVFWLSPGNLV
ncbi:MAG: hypothetical protein D6799_08200, partial [Bacteroidetes bacterium]